ncbi:MAG TPA: response regulator transcription factor [Terriglobales bacterium]
MKTSAHIKHVADSPRISVLVVDDHPAVRKGLAVLLASEGIQVCAEAGNRAEALTPLSKRRPDLAIVDLSLDGEDGLALIAELHHRDVFVLVYSMHSDALHVQSAIVAGANGYVTKREFHSVLVQAIREVVAGRQFFSPSIAGALAESLAQSPFASFEKLSPHERQVYELLGQGADTFDIAIALDITNRTVESYYSRILIKLGLNGMHELRRHAIAHLQKQNT